jgi:hypothetical protein
MWKISGLLPSSHSRNPLACLNACAAPAVQPETACRSLWPSARLHWTVKFSVILENPWRRTRSEKDWTPSGYWARLDTRATLILHLWWNEMWMYLDSVMGCEQNLLLMLKLLAHDSSNRKLYCSVCHRKVNPSSHRIEGRILRHVSGFRTKIG